MTRKEIYINKILFSNIEEFFQCHPELLESDEYRYKKSYPRDIFNSFKNLKNIYLNVRYNIISTSEMEKYLGVPYGKDTYQTYIALFRMFNFIEIVDANYKITSLFGNICDNEVDFNKFIIENLESIKSIKDFNSIYTGILCVMREGYLYGDILSFPDSQEKFSKIIPDESEQKFYREMVYKLYGFSGRGKDIDFSTKYTPNANYRLMGCCTNLGLITKLENQTNEKIDTYTLTRKGINLLKKIELNFMNTKKQKSLNSIQGGYNKIYYGIPGCGKSWHIENVVLKNVDKDNDVFRTTFYLDYTNTDFVGQIYPVVNDKNVEYKAVPGPFTKALEQAYNNPDRMVYLVVEEINRGNAAAIFGDLFQLLDRKDSGESEYPITNEFIEGYLKEKKVIFNKGKIVIPSNLTILATMNTSDQNVFPLDTAFKRRWDKQRVNVDWDDVDIEYRDAIVPGVGCTWKEFAEAVNYEMRKENKNGIVLEDKQLGPYFVKKNALFPPLEDRKKIIDYKTDPEAKDKLQRFVDNVIEYLFTDVTKYDHSILFESSQMSFDELNDITSKYDDFYNDFNLKCLKDIAKKHKNADEQVINGDGENDE